MYDHVTDFKEKLVDILGEIQGMGVIDETGMFGIRDTSKIICNFRIWLLVFEMYKTG